MVVDHDKKFIFVCIAKCASTSIRKRFGYPRPGEQDPPPEIYHMFLKDIIKNTPNSSNYFKFCFVRNPYDRLYSTYMDLKYSLGHVWATDVKNKINFKDFVMSLPQSPSLQYIHLRPQVEYIKVNKQISVDYIGRFSNLIEDFREVEQILGMSHVNLEKIRSSLKLPFDPKTYDGDMIKIVNEIYEEDFYSFGFNKK